MDKTILENANGKYLYITITRHETAICYSSMRCLFEFIVEKKGSRSVVYDYLREKVKEKLGGGKNTLSLREIKALLKPKNKFSHRPVMKIPYKSYQLMEAIIECVDNLHSVGYKLPEELDYAINQTYGKAFMKKQIDKCDEEYQKHKEEWLVNQPAKYHLHEDFHDVNSPFYKIVK